MATKISVKQLSDEVLELLSSGGGALIRDITSNVAVGAAAAGTNFPKNQTLTEFAETILLKEIAPTISTSFSGSGIKEIGTQINGSTMTLNITNTPSSSITINKIEFFEGNTLLNSQLYNGSKTYSYTYSEVIKTNTTLKAVLTYNGNKTLSGSGTFKFVYGSFYGPISHATIDATIITSLLSSFTKSIKENKSLTWNNITLNDERFCYMYPSEYGSLTSIKDRNGFEQLNGYTKYQINITYPTNSQEVSYFVYLLTDSTTGTNFTQIYN